MNDWTIGVIEEKSRVGTLVAGAVGGVVVAVDAGTVAGVVELGVGGSTAGADVLGGRVATVVAEGESATWASDEQAAAPISTSATPSGWIRVDPDMSATIASGIPTVGTNVRSDLRWLQTVSTGPVRPRARLAMLLHVSVGRRAMDRS
jgi:hypothetical protein